MWIWRCCADLFIVESVGAFEVVGYADDFLIGKSVDFLVPGYSEQMQKGISYTPSRAVFVLVINGKDGPVLIRAARDFVLDPDSGAVTGFIGVAALAESAPVYITKNNL